MVTALLRRLPIPLAEIKAKVQTLTISPGSDSAASCLKLHNHFLQCSRLDDDGDGIVTLPGKCQMHKTGTSYFNTAAAFGVTMPIFCGSVLLHQGKVLIDIQKRLLARFADDESFEISYEEPDPAIVDAIEAVLSLPDWHTEMEYINPGPYHLFSLGFLKLWLPRSGMSARQSLSVLVVLAGFVATLVIIIGGSFCLVALWGRGWRVRGGW